MKRKKPVKVIETQGQTVNIYGNNHWREVLYDKPEWSDDEEPCFWYKGKKHWLVEYTKTRDNDGWLRGFDGYAADSYFSGTLIKISECGEAVQVFTYIS